MRINVIITITSTPRNLGFEGKGELLLWQCHAVLMVMTIINMLQSCILLSNGSWS